MTWLLAAIGREPGQDRGMSAWTMLRRARPDTAALDRPPGPVAEGVPASPSALDDFLSPSARRTHKAIISGIIFVFLIVPVLTAAWRDPTPPNLASLAVAVVFVALVIWIAVRPADQGCRAAPWASLVVIVTLAITAFAISGNANWLTGLAVAAAACGRFSRTARPAAFGAISCALAGLIVALAHHVNEGSLAAVVALPPMAAFFAYSAGKRNEAVAVLRRTQAELARAAVAEERLRIARDLHDLLGHSLSLITLKAELSRRLIDTDTGRAGTEIAELESVARRSLSDVREAVAGYRQPDLAAELIAARQLLAAAGIACQIAAPEVVLLPGEVDAVLAWTIREGVTNAVRHSRATTVTITVAARATVAVVEVTDDGTQSTDPEASTGSGLAGLSERVQGLGGSMAAGRTKPGGFRLRVSIPVGGPEDRRPAGTSRN
jgi:two-component system, NarL family, sensor histidine kinase DesK